MSKWRRVSARPETTSNEMPGIPGVFDLDEAPHYRPSYWWENKSTECVNGTAYSPSLDVSRRGIAVVTGLMEQGIVVVTLQQLP